MCYTKKNAASGGDRQEEDSNSEIITEKLCDGYPIDENGIVDDSENGQNAKEFAAKSKAAVPKAALEEASKEGAQKKAVKEPLKEFTQVPAEDSSKDAPSDVSRKTSLYGAGILDRFTERWVECRKQTDKWLRENGFNVDDCYLEVPPDSEPESDETPDNDTDSHTDSHSESVTKTLHDPHGNPFDAEDRSKKQRGPGGNAWKEESYGECGTKSVEGAEEKETAKGNKGEFISEGEGEGEGEGADEGADEGTDEGTDEGEGEEGPSDETKHRYANIMMDYWFKRTFANSETSAQLLTDLLNELIPERTIKGLSYLPTEKDNLFPGMKDIRVDVECTDSEGTRFIVEMQVANQKFFSDRVLFYSAYALLEQLQKGDKVDSQGRKAKEYDYPAVYVISIVNFSMHEDTDEVLFRYELQETKTGERMTEKLNFIFLELPNCKKALTPKATILDNFCYVLKNMNMLERRPPRLKAEIFDLLFESAKIAKFTADEQVKYIKDMRTERDFQNQLSYSYDRGIDKGIAQGKAEGKAEVAFNLLMLGVEIEKISKSTGLSVEAIKELEPKS